MWSEGKTRENYDHHLTTFLVQSNMLDPAEIIEAIAHEFRLWLHQQPGTKTGARVKLIKSCTSTSKVF